MFTNKSLFGANSNPTASPISHNTDEFDASAIILETMVANEYEFDSITRDQLVALHYGVMEGNESILMEGIGDFFTSAAEFFTRMSKKIKDMIHKLFMMINAYLGNFEKFTIKYRGVLDELDPDFTILGHHYTFNHVIPQTDRVAAIVNDFNLELNDLTKITKETIAQEREEFNKDLSLERVRGEIIGITPGVRSEDFMMETKKVFRNGEIAPVEIRVNKSKLKETLDGYPELKKMFNDAGKQRDRVITVIESMKTFFSRGAGHQYVGGDRSVRVDKFNVANDFTQAGRSASIVTPEKDGNYQVLNLFYNLKFLQSKEYGNMIAVALIEKVNALREAVKQSETIVKRAINSKRTKEVS